MLELVKQKETEGSLRQEFEQTLTARVGRYLQIKPHWIKPHKHFVVASSECHLLFRDGYFYGCIALTQAVTEALVRFLCQKNCWEPEKKFEKNIDKLAKRGFISAEAKESLSKIWEKRDDFHHLNQNVEMDRQELERLAKEKINLLAKIEREIFSVGVTGDGRIVLEKPKYWK